MIFIVRKRGIFFRAISFLFSPGDSQGGVLFACSQQLFVKQGVSYWTTQNTLFITAFGIVFNNVLFAYFLVVEIQKKWGENCSRKSHYFNFLHRSAVIWELGFEKECILGKILPCITLSRTSILLPKIVLKFHCLNKLFQWCQKF